MPLAPLTMDAEDRIVWESVSQTAMAPDEKDLRAMDAMLAAAHFSKKRPRSRSLSPVRAHVSAAPSGKCIRVPSPGRKPLAVKPALGDTELYRALALIDKLKSAFQVGIASPSPAAVQEPWQQSASSASLSSSAVAAAGPIVFTSTAAAGPSSSPWPSSGSGSSADLLHAAPHLPMPSPPSHAIVPFFVARSVVASAIDAAAKRVCRLLSPEGHPNYLAGGGRGATSTLLGETAASPGDAALCALLDELEASALAACKGATPHPAASAPHCAAAVQYLAGRIVDKVCTASESRRYGGDPHGSRSSGAGIIKGMPSASGALSSQPARLPSQLKAKAVVGGGDGAGHSKMRAFENDDDAELNALLDAFEGRQCMNEGGNPPQGGMQQQQQQSSGPPPPPGQHCISDEDWDIFFQQRPLHPPFNPHRQPPPRSPPRWPSPPPPFSPAWVRWVTPTLP